MKAEAKATVRRRRHHPARYLLLIVAGAVLVDLGAVAERIRRTATVDDARPAGAIVVFGAAEYVGHPSPVYRARLDHGLELFQRGLAPLIITSGGAGGDANFSEGQVGRDYLIARGVPDINLIAETLSGDTAQSGARIARILRANGIRSCIAVSDAYHLYRVREILEAQGVTVYRSPRPASIPRTWWGRQEASWHEACSYLLWRLHLT